MTQEPKPLRSDILVPDDIILTADGCVSTVTELIHPGGAKLTFNHKILSLRPEEAINPEAVAEKAIKAIARLEAGELDSVFIRSAKYQASQGDPSPTDPIELRTKSLATLKKLAQKGIALDTFIESATRSLDSTYKLGILPTRDEAISKLKADLTSHGELFTEMADKLFEAEGVPYLICSYNSSRIFTHNKLTATPSQKDYARYMYVEAEDMNSSTPIEIAKSISRISRLTIQELSVNPFNLISNEEIGKMPGVDFEKIKYYMERKKDHCKRINKNRILILITSRESRMNAAFQSGKMHSNPALFFDEVGVLSETHFLLNYYKDEPLKSQVRDHFDPLIAYHDAAFEIMNRRVEERLESLKLPPISQTSDLAADEVTPKEPITPEQAIARADRFARASLPGHYKLRSYLLPTTDHRIALKLTNDEGKTVERVIVTGEPNAERALDIKRRVQAHLLDFPGIVPYRGPKKEGSYNVATDELIPAAEPRSRISPKYGEYRVKLDWRELNEEISIPLGLQYAADNHEEAIRRAEVISDQLSKARQADSAQTHLPLTKRDIIDHLRQHVEQEAGKWDERTHGEIEDFPAMLRFPFAKRGHEQESWLQIDELKTDGDPNYTWILPINVIVNGQRIANASTHVNLHVRDRHAADERAIETVNRLMQLINAMPPQSQWAVDPERPTHLLELSEAARNASPALIDTNRLTDLQNELRSPFQQDLTIQLSGEPIEKDGKIHFSMGVFRGNEHGVSEPILIKNEDNTPPASVIRRFVIPAEKRDDIPRFVASVNETFRKVVGEEYNPRSAMNYDAEHLRKLKAPRPFKPNFAPNVFDRAIETHLDSFSQISNLDGHGRRTRGVRPQASYTARVNQADSTPSFPD